MDFVINERIPQLARDERLAGVAGFGWGLAEGLFFFIVPDVYVTFTALYALRAGTIAWLASIGGSLVAVVLIYGLTASGADYVGWLEHVPGVSAELLTRVRGQVAAGGLPYTPWLILGGVPLKVYAGEGFALGMPLAGVLVWTVFARLARIAPVFVVAAGANLVFRDAIARHPARWCVLLVAVWVVFYVFYFTRMGW